MTAFTPATSQHKDTAWDARTQVRFVYTVPENEGMPQKLKFMRKSPDHTGNVLADSAKLVLRATLRFAAITVSLVLIGVAYTLIGRRAFDPLSIPAWFLRLSPQQWIGLGAGVVVAFIIVAVPCSRITAGVARDYETPSPSPRRIVRTLAVIAVLCLYLAGVSGAYRLSLALGHSPDWAIIHSVYSWAYVGFSFGGWVADHWKQPLGKTLRQFLAMMRM